MMNHPLKPMLRAEPIIPYNRFEWCCNHIWLHKQPLFMWHMALSMKLFGVSEITARFPSILMGSLMVVMLYGIARSMLNDKVAAFFAAILLCFCNYHLELISGYNGTDHNDVAFGFYVMASLWAYQKYVSKKQIQFALLIGLFVGCAVLNKWLLGFVVFGGWGINMLVATKDKTIKKELLHFVVALLMAGLVFIPWRLYILRTFPEEAGYVHKFNSRHITEVLEGHKGSIFYYFRQMPVYFGWLGLPFLGWGGCILLSRIVKQVRDKKNEVMWFSVAIMVFLFFSLVVKTKWPPYVFLIAPLGFICIAAGLQAARKRLHNKPILMSVIVIAACLIVFSPVALVKAHNPNDPYRLAKIHNTIIYKQLSNELPANVKIVLNVVSFEDLDVMFYNNNLNAYSWLLNPQAIDSLQKADVPIAVFKAHGLYGIPEQVSHYNKTLIIDKELRE